MVAAMEGSNDLSQRFCAQFNCLPEAFEARVFWRCLYPAAIPAAALLWYVNRSFFQDDFELIEDVKHAKSYEETKNLISFAGTEHTRRNFFRVRLRIRVSKRRLQNLARDLFPQPPAE